MLQLIKDAAGAIGQKKANSGDFVGAKKDNPIKGKTGKSLWRKAWFGEIFSAGGAIVAAVVAAIKAYEANSAFDKLSLALVIAVGVVIFGAVTKIIAAFDRDLTDDQSGRHEGLVGALYTLHAIVCEAGSTSGFSGNGLRVTFHRVVPPQKGELKDAEHLEQVVDYVGGTSNGAGRQLNIRSGITGDSIRNKAIVTFERTSSTFDDYVSELVTQQNYLQAEAEKMTRDRFSAISVPVESRDGELIGVVYMDSNEKSFFSNAAIQSTVLAAVAGITKFVGVQYE